MKTNNLVDFLSLNVEEVYQDVKRYIELLAKQFQSEHDILKALTKDVESVILNESKGLLFLFAFLNWSAFCKGVSYWSKPTMLRRLDNLPSNFEALYFNLFRKIPSDI